MGRTVKTNSGGYGKYRGGLGFETLRMVWGSADWTMFFMGNGYMNSDWGLMGGYPSATGYRFEAHNTGLLERIREGMSLPQGKDLNPDQPEFEKHISSETQVKRDKQCITTEAIFENGDLYLNYLRGGPGFGDPLDRDPAAVEDDLNQNFLLPDYAEKVYAVSLSRDDAGNWKVNRKETEIRRKAARLERIARGVPTHEWMEQERSRILDFDASVQVKQMFASSFALSADFLAEFKSFWDLPEDWELTEESLGIPMFGAKHHMDLSELPDVNPVIMTEQ